MGLFNRESNPVVTGKPEETKPPEKSPADLIAESLKPLTDGFGTVTTTLDSIAKRLEAVEQATRKPERPAEPRQVTSVLEDEDAAFAQRVGPLLLRQLEMESEVVRDRIEREYNSKGFGDLWNQFRDEIDTTLKNSPLVQPDGQGGTRPLRGDPQYIRNTVNMIIGAAAVKQGIRFDGSKKSFFLENAGGSEVGAPAPAEDGLSEAQRKMFARMGVKPDDAKKTIAKLKFIN